MSSRKDRSRPTPPEPGRLAQAGNVELHSYDVGALPLINHILEKMRLEDFFSERLPPDDPRAELPTAQGLMVMVRNVLLSRQPIYGVGEWAARFAPDLFNLWENELALLGDDRLGRNLVRGHAGITPQFVIDFTHEVSATTSFTTTPRPSPFTARMPVPPRKASAVDAPRRPSPGDTARPVVRTSSNCSTR